jgi:glycerol uptake facilitator-like aquaporin
MSPDAKAVAAEFVGTAALLAAVVGSGIMAERLSAGNAGVALLANALATGLALYVLITIFAPVSGAHFNPVVTAAAWLGGELPLRRGTLYAIAQWAGAISGVWLAHLMFDLPILQASQHARGGIGQFVSEIVATTGLLLTIAGFARHAASQVAAAVGAYIAAAYWFTASTSFANPAVTTARAMTNTFAGIAPSDAGLFILAEIVGLGMGILAVRFFFGRPAG